MPSKVFKPYNKKKTTFPSVISTLCPVMTILNTKFYLYRFCKSFKPMLFSIVNEATTMEMSVTNLTSWHYICTSFFCCRCPSSLSSSPCTSRGADTRLCPEDITHMLDFQMYFWEYFAKSHDTVIVVNIYIVICP